MFFKTLLELFVFWHTLSYDVIAAILSVTPLFLPSVSINLLIYFFLVGTCFLFRYLATYIAEKQLIRRTSYISRFDETFLSQFFFVKVQKHKRKNKENKIKQNILLKKVDL